MKKQALWAWAVAALLALLIAGPLSAAEVVLRPGYITGNVTVNVDGQTARHLNLSSYGGGYSSSNSFADSNYNITVQTGDWSHKVNNRATVSETGTTYPYTNIYFSERSIAVAENETVVNNYSAGGAIRFNVIMSGDDYSYWRGYAYAKKTVPAGEEKTDSSSHTAYYSEDASWTMPVVPNEQIRIYAYVTVYNSPGTQTYAFHTDVDEYLYRDIADGETVVIDLPVDHIAPPDLPAPSYKYGTLEAHFYLDLYADGIDYTDRFSSHSLYGCTSKINENPGTFISDRVHARDFWCTPNTELKDGDNRYSYHWPCADSSCSERLVSIAEGQTTVKQYNGTAGRVTGGIRFSGTMPNESFKYYTLDFKGISDLYDPETGQTDKSESYGGSMSREVHTSQSPGGSFEVFLPGGPWNTHKVTARNYGYDKGYYSDSMFIITDYNHYQEGSYFNYGELFNVVPGTTTSLEREYCTGTAVIRFRVSGGGLLSNPAVSGGALTYGDNGKPEMQVYLSGNASVSHVEMPEVELHGLPLDYTLDNIRVYAEDGSLIYFTSMPMSLECGVKKTIDVSAPVLSLTSPAPYLLTNAASVTVAGIASDADLVALTVNGSAAVLTSGNNPDDVNEVAFSYELPLAEGENLVTTTATNGSGSEATDERIIYVDRWEPTVEFVTPENGQFFLPGSDVSVALSSTDRGYGFNLKVYLDGTLLYEADHDPADDQAWEELPYSGIIVATSEDRVLSAVATDKAGNSSSSTLTIRGNAPPVLDAIGPFAVNEGGSVVLSAVATDAEGDTLSFAWDLDNDGTFETAGQSFTFSAANLDGPAELPVAVQVTDSGGLSDVASGSVVVLNVAPTADLVNTSGPVSEGGAVTIAFSNQQDPGSADVIFGLTYSYDCDSDGVFDQVDTTEASYACPYPDNGNVTATGIISDKDGDASEYIAPVVIENVPPALGTISASLDPLAVGTAFSAGAEFYDSGVLDTHIATWSWGDGSSSAGVVSEQNGSGSVAGNHVYTNAGVYTVTLTVTDKDGDSGSSEFYYAVIYDPDSGFVSGGGWIDSPAGAYMADPGLTGKANFGFVSKYKQGANVPTGQTEFNYRVADFNFHSTSYQWLVVAGAKAKYKGTGTINGEGEYGFMLSAIDGKIHGDGVDKFWLKIWATATGVEVYNNKSGAADDADATQAIGGGNIVIHK